MAFTKKSESDSQNLNNHDKLIIQNIFNPNNPFEDELDSVVKCKQPAGSTDDLEWTKLESDAVQLAEKGELDEALVLFEKAIELRPEKAASYNNRAQLWRLKGDIDKALLDLESAIEKSEGMGSAACQSYIQRAMIRRLQGDDDGCRSDFQLAADLGSPFAKKQLVELNPYAALCNTMLSQMLRQTSQGKPNNSGGTAS